jgi:hypothetical protein
VASRVLGENRRNDPRTGSGVQSKDLTVANRMTLGLCIPIIKLSLSETPASRVSFLTRGSPESIPPGEGLTPNWQVDVIGRGKRTSQSRLKVHGRSLGAREGGIPKVAMIYTEKKSGNVLDKGRGQSESRARHTAYRGMAGQPRFRCFGLVDQIPWSYYWMICPSRKPKSGTIGLEARENGARN